MSFRASPRTDESGVKPFVYQPAAGQVVDPAVEPDPEPRREAEAPDPAALERARQQGREETEQRLRTEYETKAAGLRAEIDSALANFSRQRTGYFERVEQEVVNLSLSVARKILHREAQIDPLVLVGLVHVALEKLDSSTCVRLRVNPAKLSAWEQHFRESPGGRQAPEVVADAAVAPDGCTLETDVGTTTIGLETHLKEIEQGFFDLLAQRPR